MIKDDIRLNTVVDTIGADILKEKAEDNARTIIEEGKGYIKPIGNIKPQDNYYRVKISPKHKIGYKNTNSQKNIDNAIKEVAEEIGINVMDIEPNRINIAVDSSLKYNDYVKLHLYIFELITFKESSRYKILCTSLDTYTENNIYFKGRDLKLSIYNKALESNGQHPYETRIEFRWCRYVTLNTKKSANKVIAKLKDIENNNAELTKQVVDKLSKRYVEEVENGSIANFTEFVRKYDKYFYTQEIIKGVYATTGLKGGFNNWFKFFKKMNPNFKVYTLSDIKKYKNMMIKSIKNYIKS